MKNCSIQEKTNDEKNNKKESFGEGSELAQYKEPL